MIPVDAICLSLNLALDLLCEEDIWEGFFHEVHQYKCGEKEISFEELNEGHKAVGPADIFILISTGKLSADVQELGNCDKLCWEEYDGPLAGRGFENCAVVDNTCGRSTMDHLLPVPTF
ncbi:hypothetical protein PI124_g12532 [Phytophthora idaei]|nr:hypothetical protein PI125_g23751 [Phytophthora idaei]KAG3128897.1 hypothetical protein PI126_g21188 [Phytophthora idaei]KAG3242638.1 hypothetical protein PI124_g12532 [Phytophthora idaei]